MTCLSHLYKQCTETACDLEYDGWAGEAAAYVIHLHNPSICWGVAEWASLTCIARSIYIPELDGENRAIFIWYVLA